MNVKIHPLGDKLASMLLGIEGVPPSEQKKMCHAVVKEAMKWYDELDRRCNKLAGESQHFRDVWKSVRDDKDRMISALKAICRNDKTYYDYGESRASDNKQPRNGGRWAAPREIAREVLIEMGIYDV